MEALSALIDQCIHPDKLKHYNGALAMAALINARDYLDSRLDLECADPDELVTMRLCDIAAGLEAVARE